MLIPLLRGRLVTKWSPAEFSSVIDDHHPVDPWHCRRIGVRTSRVPLQQPALRGDNVGTKLEALLDGVVDRCPLSCTPG